MLQRGSLVWHAALGVMLVMLGGAGISYAGDCVICQLFTDRNGRTFWGCPASAAGGDSCTITSAGCLNDGRCMSPPRSGPGRDPRTEAAYLYLLASPQHTLSSLPATLSLAEAGDAASIRRAIAERVGLPESDVSMRAWFWSTVVTATWGDDVRGYVADRDGFQVRTDVLDDGSTRLRVCRFHVGGQGTDLVADATLDDSGTLLVAIQLDGQDYVLAVRHERFTSDAWAERWQDFAAWMTTDMSSALADPAVDLESADAPAICGAS